MTIIVAKQYKDRVEIVSDWLSTAWDMIRNWFGKKIYKEWDMILGFSWTHTDIYQAKKYFRQNIIWSFRNIWDVEDEIEEMMNSSKVEDVAMIIIRNNIIYEAHIYEGKTYVVYEKDEATIWCWRELADIALLYTDDLSSVVKSVCEKHTLCGGKIAKLISNK